MDIAKVNRLMRRCTVQAATVSEALDGLDSRNALRCLLEMERAVLEARLELGDTTAPCPICRTHPSWNGGPCLACSTAAREKAAPASFYMGRGVREVSGQCNLGRVGRVVETLTDEHDKLHLRCIKQAAFDAGSARDEDHFWVPAACVVLV